MQMTLAAEFYAGTRSKAPVLDIVRIGNGNREQVETIHVINKREASTIAKAMGATPRTEERSVGKECVSTCRYRWSQENQQKNPRQPHHNPHHSHHHINHQPIPHTITHF